MPVPALRPFTHMFCCPVEHGRQAPQAGMYEQTILSPGLTRRTSGPTDSTMPAPSGPPTTGIRARSSPAVVRSRGGAGEWWWAGPPTPPLRLDPLRVPLRLLCREVGDLPAAVRAPG